MIEFELADALPEKSFDGGIALLNSLEWNILLSNVNNTWLVYTGDKVMLRTDSKEVAEAFLLGMALSFAVLDSDIVESIRRRVQ